MLPNDMYARSSADEERIKNFTTAIDRRGGSATFEKILVETSNLGSDEIRAVMTLVKSESTDFDSVKELLDYALSENSKRYQSTIRILSDNGWIRSDTGKDGLTFRLTDEAYKKLEWL